MIPFLRNIRIGKFIEAETRLIIAWGVGVIPDGDRAALWGAENVLNLDHADHCTTC